MSVLVVDASVAVKWLLPEPGRENALRLQDPAFELHAPAFLDVEVTNILWKSCRQGRLTLADAETCLSDVPWWPVPRHLDATLLQSAFDIAIQTARTVYDCLYLALATTLGVQMVTADEKFVNSLLATTYAKSVILLRDVPV